MFTKIIIGYIFGYVTVELEGYYVERVINTCISKNIYLWGIKRKKSTILTASVGAGDFKNLVKISKKHQCRIKIKKKAGLPFTIKKYRKRKIFFALLVLVFIAIFTLSKFVWNIEITGNETISTDEILAELTEEGLKIGKLKSNINTTEIINKIRIHREDIAWIGISLEGTNAVVKIVEADSKPEIVDEEDYCNIVADKDGVIEKITAQNGTIMVTEGTEVKKGDILIAGWMEGKYTGKNYVNATGTVKAKIKYSQTEKITKNEIKREETGNYENKYAIKLNNFKINFYKMLSNYKNYDTICTSKKIKLFSNFYLPIEIIKYTNSEITETEISYSYEEAKLEGTVRAEEKLNELITSEVNNEEVEVTEYDTYYEVKVTYEVTEEIGTKEKIVF